MTSSASLPSWLKGREKRKKIQKQRFQQFQPQCPETRTEPKPEKSEPVSELKPTENFAEMVEKTLDSPEAVAKGARIQQAKNKEEKYLKHPCTHPGCLELVDGETELCPRHTAELENIHECSVMGCHKVIPIGDEYCYRHNPERQRRRSERKVGTHGGRSGREMTPEERTEKEKKEKERKDRQLLVSRRGPAKGKQGGGGGDKGKKGKGKKGKK